eukprot:8333899-Pyramimonas_sp.AAC.4
MSWSGRNRSIGPIADLSTSKVPEKPPFCRTSDCQLGVTYEDGPLDVVQGSPILQLGDLNDS